ncbi:MAG: hypothetical protein J7K61_04830 [Thermoplasmata archaeon]|nr:hypothetical protein [Thermoplasmata archaeon]
MINLMADTAGKEAAANPSWYGVIIFLIIVIIAAIAFVIIKFMKKE